MPKKRQDKALLIKPGSQPSRAPSRKHESTTPSVNDLIRESRKLQVKETPQTTVAGSVPPSLRDVLNLPAPQAPAPRPGSRTIGLIRQRRIPGPPPPRSWLFDSRHAPKSQPLQDYKNCRLQVKSSTLPGGSSRDGSLLHTTLKELAVNWEWHTEYDGMYLTTLPANVKQSLLSYIDVYSDNVQTNPLRLLFLSDEDLESRKEVNRLDLAGGVGVWTSLRQLKSDLISRAAVEVVKPTDPRLASWDDEQEQIDTSTLVQGLQPGGMTFINLKHLSLAVNPGITASWKDLIQLASTVSTIESLSLAYWPLPTYTPRAATTRTIVKPTTNMPGTVYGGSNIYSAMDDDWREAAGILGTLSRTLYCLRWLDLTGCGEWFSALTWQPDDEEGGSIGPQWNGSWRGIDHLYLNVGWKPLLSDDVQSATESNEQWDVEIEKRRQYYRKEMQKHQDVRRSAEGVVRHLRELRRRHGGKWLDIELE